MFGSAISIGYVLKWRTRAGIKPPALAHLTFLCYISLEISHCEVILLWILNSKSLHTMIRLLFSKLVVH